MNLSVVAALVVLYYGGKCSIFDCGLQLEIYIFSIYEYICKNIFMT